MQGSPCRPMQCQVRAAELSRATLWPLGMSMWACPFAFAGLEFFSTLAGILPVRQNNTSSPASKGTGKRCWWKPETRGSPRRSCDAFGAEAAAHRRELACGNVQDGELSRARHVLTAAELAPGNWLLQQKQPKPKTAPGNHPRTDDLAFRQGNHPGPSPHCRRSPVTHVEAAQDRGQGQSR